MKKQKDLITIIKRFFNPRYGASKRQLKMLSQLDREYLKAKEVLNEYSPSFWKEQQEIELGRYRHFSERQIMQLWKHYLNT